MNRLLKHRLRRTAAYGLERVTNGDYKGVVPQHPQERITTLPTTPDMVADRLELAGYTYQAFAAVKDHSQLGTDSGSFAYRPSAFPEWLPEDNALRQWRPEQTQYHVHLFETNGETVVFGHYELAAKPWPLKGETWDDVVVRVTGHYNPINHTGDNPDEATYWFGKVNSGLEDTLYEVVHG